MLEDLEARQLAIQPQHSVIISAPAGSGKTQLLVTRVLKLLCIVSEPEEILALTFTNKAAGEMKERVLLALSLYKQDPGTLSELEQAMQKVAIQAMRRSDELGWELLVDINRLNITTIDSFNYSLVEKMPLITNAGLNFSICNDPKFYYERAAEAVINLYNSKEFATDLLQALKLVELDPNRLQKMLTELLATRQQWLPIVLSAEIKGFTSFISRSWEQEKANLLDKIYALASDELLELLPQDDSLEVWQEFCTKLLTKAGGIRKKYTSLVEPELLPYLNLLQELPCLQDIEHGKFKALFNLLKLAAAKLQQLFVQEHTYDFIAIAEYGLLALGDEEHITDLALKLDHKLSHILVDEFQDLSWQQYDLLEKLTKEMDPENASLFFVGDPQQSIYRFRQADPEIFNSVRDLGIGSFKPISLQLLVNFRSNLGVVSLVNNLFNKEQVDLSLTSSNNYVQAISNSTLKVNPKVCFAESEEQISSIIDYLQQNGIAGVTILVKNKSHARELLPYLDSEGIEYQAHGLSSLLEQQFILDLLTLTRILTNKYDRVAWLAFLRSPFIGLTIQEIQELFVHDLETTILQQILNTRPKELEHFISVYERAIFEYADLEFTQKFSRIFQDLGGLALLTEKHKIYFSEYINFLTRDDIKNNIYDLDYIKKQLEQMQVDEPVNSSILNIMTIHKSKGLEFDKVILYGLDRRGQSDLSNLINWQVNNVKRNILISSLGDPGYDYIKLKAKYKQQAEVNRVFYVALTRAKSELIIILSSKPSKNSIWGKNIEVLEAFNYQCHRQINISEQADKQLVKIVNKKPISINNQQLYVNDFIEPTPAIVGDVIHKLLEYFHRVDFARDKFAYYLTDEHITRQLQQFGILDQSLTNIIKTSVTGVITSEKLQWLWFKRNWDHAEYAIIKRIRNKVSEFKLDRIFIEQKKIYIIDYKTAGLLTNTRVEGYNLQVFSRQLNKYREIVKSIVPNFQVVCNVVLFDTAALLEV